MLTIILTNIQHKSLFWESFDVLHYYLLGIYIDKSLTAEVEPDFPGQWPM